MKNHGLLGVLLGIGCLCGGAFAAEKPIEDPQPGEPRIDHKVGVPDMLGSFEYIAPGTRRIHVLTTNGDQRELVPPSNPREGSYSSETIWVKAKDTTQLSWFIVREAAGRRVGVAIDGTYKFAIKGNGGGGKAKQGDTGKTKPLPWSTMSVDLTLDADFDHDGKIASTEGGEVAPIVAERKLKNDEKANPYGAFVVVGQRSDMILRKLQPTLPAEYKGSIFITQCALPSKPGEEPVPLTTPMIKVFSGDKEIKTILNRDSAPDDLWDLVQNADLPLRVEGVRPGKFMLVADYGCSSKSVSFRDCARVTVSAFNLEASSVYTYRSSTMVVMKTLSASTAGKGTADSPKTLCTGKYDLSNPTLPQAKITLAAFSDDGHRSQEFPKDIVWRIVGWAPAENSAIGELVKFEGTTSYHDSWIGKGAVLVAGAAATYEIKATMGQAEKTIRVCVLDGRIKNAPHFLFGKSALRVPFEINIVGAYKSSSNDCYPSRIREGTEALFQWQLLYTNPRNPLQDHNPFPDHPYRVSHGDKLVEALPWEYGSSQRRLGAFAAKWDGADSGNGSTNTYCMVTRDHPFVDLTHPGVYATMEANSGVYDQVLVQVEFEANVIFDEAGDGSKEETNYAILTAEESRTDSVVYGQLGEPIAYIDPRWEITEIDKPETKDLAYKTIYGMRRIYHKSTDDLFDSCVGYGLNGGGTTGFKPDYNGYFLGNDRHYHDDTCPPRGFSEASEHSIYVSPMLSSGIEVEARLFGAKYENDDEEYLAQVFGAGISASAFICYRSRTGDGSYLAGFYDTREDKLEGRLVVQTLANAWWNTETTIGKDGDNPYVGTAVDSTGACASSVGLALALNPLGWATGAVAAVSVVMSLASLSDDVAENMKYGQIAAFGAVRVATNSVIWGDPHELVPEDNPFWGKDSHWRHHYTSDGVYPQSIRRGMPMRVGDQLRTSFEIECAVQNKSRYFYDTEDGRATVILRRQKPDNQADDLNKITYSWK